MTNSLAKKLDQEPLQSVLYGLWRRQLAILVIAGLLILAGIVALVSSLLVPSGESSERQLLLGLALGCLIAGAGVGAIALIVFNPRKTRLYLLLKHSPEAIASVYFDIKFFRSDPYEYAVFQTQNPQRNYVISGIQRIGIPTTLETLRQICPDARFILSPRVQQRYFANPDSPPEEEARGLF
ncbi:MAG: hypothetical protein WBA57_25635 [Elainellaceae cyanobacterium]